MADQTENIPYMSPEEAVKIIFLAKQAGNEKTFQLFTKQLADEKIPWSFTDERFLQKVRELKAVLVTELGLQNEESAKEIAEESFSRTLSEEEREGMLRGFDKITRQENSYRDNLFQHTETLVDSYVTQLKNQGALLPEQESGVRDVLSGAARRAIETGDADLSERLIRAASSANIPAEAASAAATSITLPPEALATLSKMSQLSKITETALVSADEFHKGDLLTLCVDNPEISPEIISNKYRGQLQAEKIFSLPNDITSQIGKDLDDPAKRKAAYQEAAESMRAGISQPLNDVITAVGGPQGKEFISSVIETVMGTSLKEVEESGTIGGKNIASTVQAKEKLRHIEVWTAQRKSVLQAKQEAVQPFSQQTVTLAADLWGPRIREGMIVYLESVNIKVSARAPEYFHYIILAGGDIWNTILGRSVHKVAGETIKKAAGGALKTGAGRAAGAAVGAVGGIPGAIIGFVGQKVVGRALSFVWGGIKGLFSGLGGLFSGVFQPQPTRNKMFFEQLDWQLVILSLVALLFCTGMTFFRETTTTAAIVAEKEEKGSDIAQTQSETPGRGWPHGDTDPEWEAAVAAASKIKREKKTPVDFSTIRPENAEFLKNIQENVDPTFLIKSSDPNYTPRVTQPPGGSYTHGRANAVDVGAPLQSLVLSPVNGTITKIVDEYADGSGYAGNTADGGGYGNYIEITTAGGYVLRVAHLAYHSMPPEGTRVSVGDVIGRSGQTGNSTGPHIHFEYTSWDVDIMSIFNQPTP